MSLIIRKVSKAIGEFLGKDYMKLPETAAETENLTQKCLKHHWFPQCIRARVGTHIRIRRPNQNYADCINWKGFISINVQALCNRYCFLDVAVRWPGAFMTQEYFSSQNLTKFVPSCNRQIVESEMKVPICILGDSTYPLLPHLTKEYQKGGKDEKEHILVVHYL